MEEAAFSLENNGVSDVLQLGDQWIILQSVRRIPASNPSPQALPAIRNKSMTASETRRCVPPRPNFLLNFSRSHSVDKFLGDAALTKQHPGVAAIINGEQVSVCVVGEECIKRHGLEVLEGEINRKLLTQALRNANKTSHRCGSEKRSPGPQPVLAMFVRDGSPDLEAWMESVMREGKTTEAIYIADAVWPSVALDQTGRRPGRVDRAGFAAGL